MDKSAGAELSWSHDVLPEFSQAWLGRRGSSPVLVRLDRQPERLRGLILHVHGYNDYFFQEHLAHFFRTEGFAFYAVEMRGAGRAMEARALPHYMDDISEPGDDIETAARALEALHPGAPLIVHAHSTGGLSAVIWAADRAVPALRGLILNSPLFGRREKGFKKHGAFLLPLLRRVAPRMIVSHRGSVYSQHLHVNGDGRWEFDTELKSPRGVPARAAWAAAVRRAQHRLSRGLHLEIPVLVARSAQTGPEDHANPDLGRQDIVVDVNAIARLAPRIGPRVTELVVQDGLHDLCLSDPEPRERFLAGVKAWLDEVAP